MCAVPALRTLWHVSQTGFECHAKCNETSVNVRGNQLHAFVYAYLMDAINTYGATVPGHGILRTNS